MAVQGRWFRYQSKALMQLPKFLLAMNSNLGSVLHRPVEVAFKKPRFLGFLNKKAQLSLTNPRDACEKFARFM